MSGRFIKLILTFIIVCPLVSLAAPGKTPILVTVKVINELNNQPVEGITVTACAYQDEDDAFGPYSFYYKKAWEDKTNAAGVVQFDLERGYYYLISLPFKRIKHYKKGDSCKGDTYAVDLDVGSDFELNEIVFYVKPD